MCRGYWVGDGVEEVNDSKGWFRTRDVGHIADKGNLVVTGRKDNMFISGGENIHPEEIEKCLLEIESIRRAIVVPIEDPEFGYRPMAIVDAPSLDFVAFRNALAAKLPSFKLPKTFLGWPKAISEIGIKPSRVELGKYAAEMCRK